MSDFKSRAAGEKAEEEGPWPEMPEIPVTTGDMEKTPRGFGVTIGEERVERACTCGNLYQTTRFTFGEGRVLYSARACPTCVEKWPDTDLSEGTARKQANVLQAMHIPPRYSDVTLGNYRTWGTAEEQDAQGLALRTMGSYISRWPKVPNLLVLQGPPGTGKGHFLWAVMKAVAIKEGQPLTVVKLSTMIRDLRGAWRDKDGPSEDARLAKYRKPLLLGIDEVSRHAFYGEQIMQHLYDVLDDRLEWCRPTILTTNEDDEWLHKVLGPALVDRIQGDGGVVECKWRSFRVHGEAIP